MDSAIRRFAAFVTGVLIAAPLSAEPQPGSIEAAARIGAEHESRLDRRSVARFGDLLRYEVRVGWKDAALRPATQAPLRIVRYLARCESREVSVAAVAVIDTSGQMLKSYGVPPGAWEYARPVEGSPEAEALEAACRMPV
jgi:hypothetical protein